MYGSDKDKDTKLKSLKDLGSKMRELHAHSVKGNSQAMTDSMPNPKKVRNEEDTEDKSEMSHQDREDSKHDDMNEDGMNEESNLESHPSHDSQAMHDNKPNPKMPSNSKSMGKPTKHSNAGDSEETHDEHGPLSAHEPANEESNETPHDLHRSHREDSMHHDENSSSNPEFNESSHEGFQHDSGGSGSFGDEESPEDDSHDLAPLTLHPGLVKLLHEHLKSRK